MKAQDIKKIVIIGGGLSGLTAANDLLTNNKQIQVIVLEAMDRVGGRTCSIKINDAYYDLGGTWIGPKQQYVKKLAEQSKNQIINQYCQGTKIIQFGKRIQTYSSDIPTNLGILGLIQLQYNLWKIDKMANQVPLDNPANCKKAVQWDSQTVATWINSNIWSQRIKILIQVACRAIIGADTNQVSLLFFLWYTHQSYGIQNLVNIKNGNQQKKMKYGAQHMSKYLKQQIQNKGGKVLLNQFVNKINQDKEKCVIQTINEQKYQSDFTIIAMPPCNVKKIHFQPDLPPQRKMICNKNTLGTIIKVILLYDRPYWRQKGFSGQTISDCFDSPIFNAYDDTRIKQNGQLQYGIVVFINGNVVRQWEQREDRHQIIKQRLSDYFKSKEMLQPIHIQQKNWEKQSSIDGAPIAFYPPGVLTQIKNFRKPEGKIHWAGTQMALISQGFMDGAIQSGKRVSKQILDVIKNKDSNKQQEKIQKKQDSKNEEYFYTKIMKSPRRFFGWV